VTEVRTGRGSPSQSQDRTSGWHVTSLTLFLTGLGLVLAVYAALALGLEWRTAAGRIGPGFFPRIVGVGGIILCVVCAIRSMRVPAATSEAEARTATETEAETSTEAEASTEAETSTEVEASTEAEAHPDPGRHPGVLLMVAAAMILLFVLLEPLGAIVAGAIFLLVTLWILGRGHPVLNVILSVAVPVGLYLLFDTLLNAGLPAGLLPMF